MLKLLIVTKNNPAEAMVVTRQLYESIGELNNRVFIGSPQFTAWQVSEVQNIPYLHAYYPALRAYKKIDDMAGSDIDVCITVGTADLKDFLNYNAVVGIENKEINDYKDFPEEFNTTNMTVIELKHCEIKFYNMNELIHFIKIVINNYYRQEDKNE